MNTEEKLIKCFKSIEDKIPFNPRIAVVLGSGLGDYASQMKIQKTIRYADIDGFPLSTVEGHKGQFVFGYMDRIPVVMMQGRVHYYEGYDMSDVVLPVRLLKLMGCEFLILTNAAGGINPDFRSGDLMMITDHIASFVPNCLRGKNIDMLGERFPDMSQVYDVQLCEIIRESAEKTEIQIKEGTYIQLSGPSYETPGEVKMCAALGADAVGMSTACEAVAANHMKMRICAISFISNPAAGICSKKLSHEDVQSAARDAQDRFTKLVTQIITEIGLRYCS
ncbi:MAG: purine-nucleoside phosphorylase [Oscillospiraceae bacterium]|nr:purine-nucleoside phosphorylase [Oscillospiraceae bacterium]